MSPNIAVKMKMRERGILDSLGLSFLGGQSFLSTNIQRRTAQENRVVSAPLGNVELMVVRSDRDHII